MTPYSQIPDLTRSSVNQCVISLSNKFYVCCTYHMICQQIWMQGTLCIPGVISLGWYPTHYLGIQKIWDQLVIKMYGFYFYYFLLTFFMLDFTLKRHLIPVPGCLHYKMYFVYNLQLTMIPQVFVVLIKHLLASHLLSSSPSP